jgi:hypothetical protein
VWRTRRGWLAHPSLQSPAAHAESPKVLLEHLTPDVCAILSQVASESRDRNAHIYTQAEMVRAIELAKDARKLDVPKS